MRPNIHMAALDLWRYYTRDDMTSGPAYEPDLWVVKRTGKDKKRECHDGQCRTVSDSVGLS